jgi:hypothetical protein
MAVIHDLKITSFALLIIYLPHKIILQPGAEYKLKKRALIVTIVGGFAGKE